MEEVFPGHENVFFFVYPSYGKSRDKVYMKQFAATGRPTHAAESLAHYVLDYSEQDLCLAITGASSARAAHIVKEAFSLLPSELRTANLQLLFIGEPAFKDGLKKTVEDRGGRFLFREYIPRT